MSENKFGSQFLFLLLCGLQKLQLGFHPYAAINLSAEPSSQPQTALFLEEEIVDFILKITVHQEEESGLFRCDSQTLIK